jgi:hypothetical protein
MSDSQTTDYNPNLMLTPEQIRELASNIVSAEVEKIYELAEGHPPRSAMRAEYMRLAGIVAKSRAAIPGGKPDA